MTHDRRAHLRYELGFGARVHTGSGVVACSTQDMSRGGCRLISDRPLRDGEQVDIELCLTIEGFGVPDHPHLRIKANVAWSAEGEDFGEPCHVAGVQFEPIAEDKAQWLESILRQNKGQYAQGGFHGGEDFDVDIDDF